MLKVILFATFIAIASAQTMDSVSTSFPDFTSEAPEPGVVHNAECTCYAQLPKGRISTAKLLGDLLNNSPKPEVCNNQGMVDCIKYCEEHVAKVSNGFDLNSPPKTREGLTVPLGQYVCNLLGRNVRPTFMRLYAELNCHTQSGSMTMRTHHVSSTNGRSKQALECLDGKFVPEENEE